MARQPLEWKNLPEDGMPKTIATAYQNFKDSQEALRVAIEKHMAKKLNLDLDSQQVIISVRRGLGYAVKARSAGTTEGEW
jgi:hypothetical protein